MHPDPERKPGERQTFATTTGTLLTMIGVAVGLGNIWRFPYMVGHFGGAAFVLFYIVIVVLIGIPALMTEWTLGRYTRLGTVGAYARAGFPMGRHVGWLLFAGLTAGVAYYTTVVGWVLYYAVGEVAVAIDVPWNSAAILPPETGFVAESFALQMTCTGVVILACAVVLLKGLRSGIEPVSKVVMPGLLITLIVLIVRSLTLPGAWDGLHWYLLKFNPGDLTPKVMVAAMGQAVFSLSLGGTFMVVYGSYLNKSDDLRTNATWTAVGDATAGLLAGLAIFPAVFAFGLEPSSGPGLLFSTLPAVFAQIPVGWLFGLLFFAGLFGAAYLSDVAGFEVLVTGITDNTGLTRTRAVWLMAAIVFLLSLVPMINTRVFVSWDLTFGSGIQIVGSLLAVVTVGWAIKRSEALREFAEGSETPFPVWLYYWVRFVIPAAMLLIGVWWLLSEVLGAVGSV